ncbi:VanZ family protein [Candidatus Nitrotoga arctica]|uniref:VanZ like family protein n=1 Tax=Candidatus Nitrotoga arctica TaxID=453162 RepID=A0ABM8Z0K9_9PROT|nr:VanZ family protein [Candidatus Nitrotoga arctica]CAG9933391.1 VanZ like family protein [Candidatus Nitrotoga arctica]
MPDLHATPKYLQQKSGGDSLSISSARFSILALAIVYTLFVIYGSLVPLDFHPRPWDQAWEMFQHISLLNVGTQGRADWVANGVLYVPVGFLTVTLFTRFKTHRTLVLAFIGSLLFSFTLAVTVEFAQLFFPPRTVSINDVIAEFLGSILGAVFAVRWPDRFMSFLSTLMGNPDRLVAHLLKAYAIGYVAFSLFPYDFLVSVPELEWKLHSDGWGWLVASESVRGNIALPLAKLFAETLAVVPLGLILCQLTIRGRPWSFTRAFVVGAVLGLIIEIAQFFIVSGISQGLSVFTRATGICLGALFWRHRTRLHLSRLASEFRRFGLPMGILYLIALTAVNGWFEHRWIGNDFAMSILNDIHFLPFYYHYYSTEQVALLSLTSICLLYAPIGILAWASWNPPGLAMLMAMLLAGFMETSKLYLETLHPDPTNILLAGFSAWATAKLVNRLASAPTISAEISKHIDSPMTAASTYPMRSRPYVSETEAPKAKAPAINNKMSDTTVSAVPLIMLKRPSLIGYAVLIAGLASVGWGVATFPSQPALLAALFAGYAVLLWYRPQLIFIVVPAALAFFDLAPWSGRFYFDEFDFLLLTSVTVGYVRLPPARRHSPRDLLFLSLAALLGLSYAIGILCALLPWQTLEANSFTNYYSPYNALRIAKGALWAFLIYGLLGRLASIGQDVRGLFARGMVAGLAGTIVMLAWERFVFPGLFNFTDVYRVTGPFSQMHTGGADIESFLTLSTPFLVVLLFERRSWVTRLTGTALLVGATYGVMVTFSRIGYVAFGIAMALALLMAMAKSDNRVRTSFFKRGMAAFVLVILALAVAVPIFKGPFTQTRMSQAGVDLEVRLAHWADALQMRDPGWPTALFGMGIGRYPETHSWRSEENRAATYRLGSETGNTFLRLGTGSPLYVEQFVTIEPQRDYLLSLNARSDQPNTQVSVSICEKWLLTSARCTLKSIDVTGNGRWQSVQTRLQSGDVGSGRWYASRPVKLSIYNSNAHAVVDVDNVRVQSMDGGNLLGNGEFSMGLDRWFFTVDNDRPWHIWSLPIQVLFDQGWLGLVALTFFVVVGLWRAGRDTWRGDAIAGAMLASSIGFLVIGTLDSLVDSPRLILLFLLLIRFCWGARMNPPAS